MADENISGDDLFDGEDVLPDQSAGNQHSVFLDDEELHEQLANEGEGDERTALTAAHQGARGTSTPADTATAFTQSTNESLLNSAGERVGSRANSANAASNDTLIDGADGIQDGVLPEQSANGDEATGAAGARAPGSTTSAADQNLNGSANSDFNGELASDATENLQQGDASGSADAATVENQPGTGQAASNIGQGGGQSGGQGGGQSGGQGGGQSGGQGGGQGNGQGGDQDNGQGGGQDNGQGGGQGGGNPGGGGGGFNPITGTDATETLNGTAGADLIVAMDGDDTIDAGAGDDRMFGNLGNDVIQGGLGDDTMEGGHGDDTFLFSDTDFDGNAWTDSVDGQGTPGKAPMSDYDTIDLTGVTQGWSLEVDGAGAGAEATNLTNPSEYTNGGEFSGTITFDDGSTVVFDNIEKVDW
ncbi:MAG: hypothetical protein GKS02_04530 [Alphaproteobacteria bacterium]|nr:hypothetical protein [Alphaproteobacteria bacterium]